MKILFDTNVVLDHLLDRKPFVEDAQELFVKVESGKIEGYIGATTVTTLDYLLMTSLSIKESKGVIRKLLKLFEIAPVNRLVLEDTIDSGFKNFEDAVLHAAAMHSGVQALVTRNEKGFSKAQLAVYSPKDLLGILSV
jgi:predicted nucleic acid-binding protein